MKYPHLFEPFKLSNMTLKNRLVMSPMTMNYATSEGFITDKVIQYYLERAKGGVGLIVVEGTFFSQEGKGYKNQLGIASSEHARGLRALTKAIHGLRNDVKIFVQIQHAGGRASSKVTGLQSVAPSAVPSYPGAELPRALTRDGVQKAIDDHIQAACWAKEAGFDGVDIHCAHGYLIPGFFSPLTNQRTDGYGGDIYGRARFLLEIVQGIRKRVGKDYPLTIKISGDEFIEGGLDYIEMTQIARLAQEAGVDGITVSAGSVGARKIGDLREAHKILRTLPMMTQPCCLVPLAAEIKKSLTIPVITVGRIHQPALAEEILAQGKADLVAMGRPLLADPHLPQKAFEGREKEIRPCIACNEGCYKRIFQQLDIQCSVNPTLGKENEILPPRSSQPKKVFIIGGGPAGLEAANAAWEKGHEVVLVEKAKRLGGQLNLASIPPGRKEIEKFREFLLNRIKRTDVKVIMGEELDRSFFNETKPEAVILATGACPISLEIPGLHQDRISTAWEVLAGEKKVESPCLVLGAGLVGSETADYLSEQGNKVILVEVLPEIATDADADTKTYFNLRFQESAVEVYASSKVQRVEGNIAILQQWNEERRVQFGTFIFAVGVSSNATILDRLPSELPVNKIGDCMKPRTILEAVQEGFQAGRAV